MGIQATLFVKRFSKVHFRFAVALMFIIGTLISTRSLQGRQFPNSRESAPMEVQIEGKPYENFRYLAAQCWLPQSKSVRAILCIVLHPDGSNGGILAESREWRALAHAHDAALLGVSIVPSSDATKLWFDASAGSGEALLSAVARFAQIAGRPDLLNAPLLVAGVCAAGQFAYEFSAFKPDRTLGFVTVGGAKHRMEHALRASSTHGLLIVTPDRGKEAAANLESLSALGRLYSAPWKGGSGMISDYDAGFVGCHVLDFIETLLTKSASEQRLNRAQSLMRLSSPASMSFSHKKPSFLGEPLPIIATSEVSKVAAEPGRFDIRIKSKDAATFDSVSVPNETPGKASISKVSDNEWQVAFTVDRETTPTGTFQFEVPIRLLRSGVPDLGGLQVPVNGTLTGDIYPRPSTVRIDWTATERESSFELHSKAKNGISEIEIERVVPAWISARLDDATSTRIMLRPRLEATNLPATVAGYLIIRATSDNKQRIKVPFYGTIKS